MRCMNSGKPPPPSTITKETKDSKEQFVGIVGFLGVFGFFVPQDFPYILLLNS